MKSISLPAAMLVASISSMSAASENEVNGKGEMAKNGIYLEGLGPGGIYSLNYERIIANAIAPRIGFSVLSVSVSDGTTVSSATQFSIPVTVSYVGVHQGMHGLEVGAGGAIYFGTGRAVSAGATSTSSGEAFGVTGFAGYRLHPVEKAGFQFRVGLGIQGIFASTSSAILPWPYLSVGGAF